jgi:hypothetical protein
LAVGLVVRCDTLHSRVIVCVHFSSKIVSDEHTGNLDIRGTSYGQPRQRP